MPNRWGSERYLEIGPRSCLQASEGRRSTKPGERLLSPLREFVFLPLVAALALSTSSAAQEASQGAGLVAMGVEAYAASKGSCYYRPEVGDTLEKLEDYFSSQANGEWDTIRADARKQLVLTHNLARLASRDPYNASVAQQCRVYGSAVGLTLDLSVAVIKPDRVIVAESDRLNKGGARVASEVAGQKQQVETPPVVTPPSGQFTNGAGTNMGPGYRSTYGRPAESSNRQTVDAVPRPSPGGAHGRLAYGGRDGQQVDITSVSGLDTEHAMIGINQTRANAVAACISLEKAASPQCVSSMLATPFRNAVYANCKTGVIVDFRGRKYRFEGPTPLQSDEGGHAKYRIENSASSEILTDTTADGYRIVMRLYQDLCPVTAPSDM